MDREILFRAKQVCNNEWIEGYYLNCYYPGNSTDQTGHFIVEYPGKYHEIYLGTICQYTGLTDKNGRKVFEGDIVKTKYYGKDSENGCNFNDYDVFVIDYGEATFRLDNEERRFFLTKLKDIEVIGNIFDNPDLLKE